MADFVDVAYVTRARGASAARMNTLMAAVVPPRSVYADFFGLRITSDVTTAVNPITRTIRFAFGPSGVTDAAPVIQNDGSIIRIVPGNRGNDYIRPPFVSLTPVVRTQALLRAFLRVNSFTLVSGGAGYATAPTVRLIGGFPPAGRVFTGCVRRIYIKDSGLGYPATTRISIDGGGPAGPNASPTIKATATPTIDAVGRITAITLTDMGAGYTQTPTVTFRTSGVQPTRIAKAFAVMADGTPALAHATIDGGGAVNAVILDSPGEGYTSVPTVVFTGGGGAGASAVARLELDRVDTLFGGTGYPAATAVVFTPYFKQLFPDTIDQAAPFIRIFRPQYVQDAVTPIIASAPVLI